MVEKKYQIFVSSTVKDLKNERKRLRDAILKENCIPVEMEYFPAKDVPQMDYIRPLIDKCDYIVLVVGLQYGTMENGVSYTEQEYEYAVEKGKTIIALVQEETESNQIDKNAETYEKLVAFRKKVQRDRIVCLWKDMTDLIESFHVSIKEAFTKNPEVGWVRGNKMNNATDIKMEAYSASNPSVVSENKIECVSLAIKQQIKRVNLTLFDAYRPLCSRDSILRYYRSEALPWFIRMAKICQINLKVTNLYTFPLNKIEWEDRLFDQEGKEIQTHNYNTFIYDPPRPPYDPVGPIGIMPFHKQDDIYLNPNKSTILPQSLFYLPDQEQDLIFQRTFFAENIQVPIKKEIRIHFRIMKVESEFNDLVELIQDLEYAKRFDYVGVLDMVRVAVNTEGKEQDSCDTQK